jgi:hypothetical protein
MSAGGESSRSESNCISSMKYTCFLKNLVRLRARRLLYRNQVHKPLQLRTVKYAFRLFKLQAVIY